MINQSIITRYEEVGLAPVLRRIRSSFLERNGVNILANASSASEYDRPRVEEELRASHLAGKNPERGFVSGIEGSSQGLSYGLLPYTDWSLAQIESNPAHWFVFLGLDWFSVADLIESADHPDAWFEAIDDPFGRNDPYWDNLWRWILSKAAHDAPESGPDGWLGLPSAEEAKTLIQKHQIGMVFHNLVPYLRPHNERSSGTDWFDREWSKTSIVRDSLDCVASIVSALAEPTIFCTRGSIRDLITRELGIPADRVISFGCHPSYFHAGHFRKKDLWFPVPCDATAVKASVHVEERKVIKPMLDALPTMDEVQEFKDGDDQGFYDWLASNTDGFVLSIEVPLRPTNNYMRLHRVTCGKIRALTFSGKSHTTNHIKVCGSGAVPLEAWAMRKVTERPTPCGLCKP